MRKAYHGEDGLNKASRTLYQGAARLHRAYALRPLSDTIARTGRTKAGYEPSAEKGEVPTMLKVTQDMVLPTTMTGSYPKPNWYDQGLRGRPFKQAMGDSLFREQYLDAVATIINDQTMAGLDIVTDGDTRFDLEVGGKSWFFYDLERMGGLRGARDLRAFAGPNVGPGHIFWEIQEAYQSPVLVDELTPGPLHYPELWKVAQRMTDKPVKFGSIASQSLVEMISNDYYSSTEELVLRITDIKNRELKELAASGCRLIQVEEPVHHFLALEEETTQKDLEFYTEAFNREVDGVDAEIWVHTCWGNPSQQRSSWEPPSYERSLPYLLDLDADVITFECASSNGEYLPLFGQHETSKKIAIGVVSHTNTVVEPPEVVADLVRKALDYIPPERLILSTDCGFGREGLSRRIALYKCVSIVQGANIVRRELGLPEAPVPMADPRYAFGEVPGLPGDSSP